MLAVFSQATLYRLAFVGLVLLTLAFSTTPDLTTSWLILWPDLVYCLTVAWLVRRPEHVPPWLVAGLLLIRDVILGLPPGLWAALVVLTGIVICLLRTWLQSQSFLLEWIMAAALYFLALSVMQGILLVAQLPVMSLATMVRATVVTILAYPLVVLFLHSIVRVRVSYGDSHAGAPGWL